MNPSIVQKLKDILGQEACFDSLEDMACYRYDATHLTGKTPLIALYPTDVNQVSEIMKVAHEEGLYVIPRGAGTGLAGGGVPVKENAIILHLSKLNRIIEIDKENLTVTVEAGVVTEDLQAEAENWGCFIRRTRPVARFPP